jgi:hypothetical protein
MRVAAVVYPGFDELADAVARQMEHEQGVRVWMPERAPRERRRYRSSSISIGVGLRPLIGTMSCGQAETTT